MHGKDFFRFANAVMNSVQFQSLRVFNDLIDDFTKSDFKSFLDDFAIFEITLKKVDLI
jgi:hypothetical protein